MRASRRSSGTISIASSTAAPIWRSTAARLARAAAARRRGHARGRATAGRPARFHDIPLHRMPGQIAGEDARPARRDARRRRGARQRRSARSFLHNQVRSMVGSLVHVGEGKWSADDLAAALAARDRTAAARSRRRKGFIWCGWSIEDSSLRASEATKQSSLLQAPRIASASLAMTATPKYFSIMRR